MPPLFGYGSGKIERRLEVQAVLDVQTDRIGHIARAGLAILGEARVAAGLGDDDLVDVGVDDEIVEFQQRCTQPGHEAVAL